MSFEFTHLHPPTSFTEADGTITLHASPICDFWYSATEHRDSGNFYYRRVEGDFKISTFVKGAWNCEYDQAGVMIRVNEKRWIKAGIEFMEGKDYVRYSNKISSGFEMKPA